MDKSRFEGQAEEIAAQVADADTIKRLSKLPPIEYERARTDEAKRLGIRASTLDAEIKAARASMPAQDASQPFKEVEPWPEPIDPAELFNELSATIKRYIVCSKETADAAALWATMTWFIDVVMVAALLLITAPEKRCGKTQFLSVLWKLVKKPLAASSISPAALFRSIDAWRPTLLIDEADAFMKDNEELRGLLNAGHTRDSAYVIRVVGENFEPKAFSVWGAKAVAGIGHLADTLMDRGIVLELRRKTAGENVQRLRHAGDGLFDEMASKLARFSVDYAGAVIAARPSLPPELNDRAQDNWEPLLAIADIAGIEWSHRARAAAIKLSGHTEHTLSIGVELLLDIQEFFDTSNKTKVYTADIVQALTADAEKTWATYNRGKPMTPKQLTRRLGEYGISSKQMRVGYENKKGFERAQFEDAFSRYLSTPPDEIETSIQPNIHAGFDVSMEPKHHQSKSSNETLKPSTGAACIDVSIQNGVTGQTHRKMVWRRDHKRTFRRVVVSPQHAAKQLSVVTF